MSIAAQFSPENETSEGWRKYFGWIACLCGWHFGQILISDPEKKPYTMICATCKSFYLRKE